MSIDENLILGIKDEPIGQPLLKTLAFSDAYKYKVKTVGKDNESIETGELLANILNSEQKNKISNGEETITVNNLEITRITGIEPKKEEKKEVSMTYDEMKKFVKENNIKVDNFKKETLIKALEEYNG